MQQDGQILKTLYWAKIKPDKREYILYDSIYVKLSKKKKNLIFNDRSAVVWSQRLGVETDWKNKRIFWVIEMFYIFIMVAVIWVSKCQYSLNFIECTFYCILQLNTVDSTHI